LLLPSDIRHNTPDPVGRTRPRELDVQMAKNSMIRPGQSTPTFTGSRPLVAGALALAAVLGLAAPRTANAQIFRATPVNPLAALFLRGSGVAYDPNHSMYLFVGGQGVIQGLCANAGGGVGSGVVTIQANTGLYSTFPRVAFSPQSP